MQTVGGSFHLGCPCLRRKVVSCSRTKDNRDGQRTVHAAEAFHHLLAPTHHGWPCPLNSRGQLCEKGEDKTFLTQVAPRCSLCYDRKQLASMFCSPWRSAIPKERISEVFFFFNAEDIIMSWRTCLLTFYKLCLVLRYNFPSISLTRKKWCLDVCPLMRHFGCRTALL